MSQEINISVTWKYTSPRQYKDQKYTFNNQKHYDTWFKKMISDESLRKIIEIKYI